MKINLINSMKNLALAIVATLALTANADEPQWLTDLPKAQAQAKAEKKLVFLDFTGSDWCGWCIKQHKEVFTKPEFAKYAQDNLVLVEVDFPHNKKLSRAQTKANEALASKYKVDGFPTFVVLNSEGKKIGEFGYIEGGPKPFIEKLAKLKK